MIDRLQEAFKALSPQQKRTAILAVVAGTLVSLFLITQLIPGDTAANAGGGAAGEVAVADAPASGAPIELGREGLSKRYDPVLDAELFAVRSFRPRPKNKPRPRVERPRREDPPPPSTIKLRLTSLLGTGKDRHGVLEEGGTGRGLIAKGGGAFGETTVAEVQTSSVVVVESGKKRSLELGESLTLPVSFKSSLKELRPPTPKGLVRKKSYSSSTTPAVELTDEKKMSLLEKLRAARKNSMNKKDKEASGDKK